MALRFRGYCIKACCLNVMSWANESIEAGRPSKFPSLRSGLAILRLLTPAEVSHDADHLCDLTEVRTQQRMGVDAFSLTLPSGRSSSL